MSCTKKTKVVVGMSGGVDSSVCAALLKEQGFDVVGLFMRNWEETDENGHCSAEDDYQDVISVCEKLEIPYYSINLSQEYHEHVFQEFLNSLKAGETPNPDVLCNKEIKFKYFFDYARQFGADFVATGHYCRIEHTDQGPYLLKGRDANKDQTYFLHAIDPKVLPYILFPVGELQKSEVRAIAQKYNFVNKSKKDSTGICFIGERNFKEFIGQYISYRPGEMKTLGGQSVGQHQGVAFYTLGQRKGLGLGGPGEPWFVVQKDTKTNTLYVERGEHPAMYSFSLQGFKETWLEPNVSLPLKCQAKIRYRQKDQDCELSRLESGEIQVVFEKAQRAITPMQYVVFYLGERCLGGAQIKSVGLSLFETHKSPQAVIIQV